MIKATHRLAARSLRISLGLGLAMLIVHAQPSQARSKNGGSGELIRHSSLAALSTGDQPLLNASSLSSSSAATTRTAALSANSQNTGTWREHPEGDAYFDDLYDDIDPIHIEISSPNVQHSHSTFAGEVSDKLMSRRLVTEMRNSYGRRLEDFSSHQAFYATSLASERASHRGYSYEREVRVRQTLARSMRNYMLLRGLPEIIRERVKSEQVRKAVSTYSRVARGVKIGGQIGGKSDGKKRESWKYDVGLRPTRVSSFVQLKRGEFITEAEYFLMLSRRHRSTVTASQGFGKNRIGTTYFPLRKVMAPSYTREINPNLTCGVRGNVHLSNLQRHSGRVFMNYSF